MREFVVPVRQLGWRAVFYFGFLPDELGLRLFFALCFCVGWGLFRAWGSGREVGRRPC